TLPLEERLQYYITEGLKMGLVDDLNKALETYKPMDIINNHLMIGMGVVGKRFNANELTVIDVLQSAEVMKASVDHLKQFMKKGESAVKGKILLATVKGDVHDIGKNLVEIVFSNNGYEIVDLGVKVDSQKLIDGFNKHKPDAIGLSGLLVKSAIQMTITAEDLRNSGIDVPLFIGGAALSEKFTVANIQPNYGGMAIYAKDAINGLGLVEKVFSGQYDAGAHKGAKVSAPTVKTEKKSRAAVNAVDTLPQPAHFDFTLIDDIPLDTIFTHINNQMLFGKHLGLKGGYKQMVEKEDPKALETIAKVDEIKKLALEKNLIKPRALYKFFKVKRDKDAVLFLDDNLKELERFHFPRQKDGERLCLSDYVDSERIDTLALFCTTAGEGIAELCGQYKEEGEYTLSHALFSLALETSEAMAELVHKRIRADWGFGDPPSMTIPDLLQVKYHGCRYSLGYPACPDLDDQAKLFKLLEITNRTGIRLTDEKMMIPEASVTALAFHHPEAKYFAV
ncbi:MAG: methionine synthase, partial [bacterium]|nr:methionine synthase [bacterium]